MQVAFWANALVADEVASSPGVAAAPDVAAPAVSAAPEPGAQIEAEAAL